MTDRKQITFEVGDEEDLRIEVELDPEACSGGGLILTEQERSDHWYTGASVQVPAPTLREIAAWVDEQGGS